MSPQDGPLDFRYGNLASLLWHSADRAPDAAAIIDGSGELSFRELRGRAATIGVSLQARGVAPGDRVAIFLERSAEAAASIFGALAVGAIVVCINDRLRPRQIEYMLRHSGSRVLITTQDMLSRHGRPVDTTAAVLDLASVPAAAPDSVRPVPRVGSDLAQIIYTSGSTGLPKGVSFTHANLSIGVDIVTRYLALVSSDRVASLLAFSSVYGLNQLLCAVNCGASLVIETSPLPHNVVGTLREHAATVVAAVPPLWAQLLTVPEFQTRLPSLRMLQNAGGHLPATLTGQLRRAQPQASLFLQYGMTETFRSTFLPPEEVDRRPDCMGRAIPGTEIMVLRDDLTECDAGEIGELVHRGPTVAAGYWNDEPATERVFRPNPRRVAGAPSAERVVFSGDLVRRDPDGYLYYVSRRDRLIKTLGFRVGPDEIGDVLFSSGEIKECVITTEPDPQRGDAILAFVVLADGGSLDRVKQFCRLELPRYMQPARIESLEAIPRLASGKYDVAALKESVSTT